jgi:hypothetical protein
MTRGVSTANMTFTYIKESSTDVKFVFSGGRARVSACPMASGPLIKWAPLNIRQYVKNVNDLLVA